MKFRRNRKLRTNGSWTPESSARAHAAKARLRIERAEQGLTDPEPERIPEGAPLGVLSWHAADGSVRRWVITQGPRANNIAVTARLAGADHAPRVMGWDRLLAGLRRRLAIPKRTWTE
jgi:hypothetical protein